MRWSPFSRQERPDAGARFRREHEAWLTWAFASGARFPLIPLRRVDPSIDGANPVGRRAGSLRGGGFDPMMARESGRRRAERWWSLALDRVDASPKGLGHG